MPSPLARPLSPAAGRFRCQRHDVAAGVVRVSLAGVLDADDADVLDQVLEAAHADGAFAVIDVDELTCLDAAGARVLCAAASRAGRQGRRMVVVNACPEVHNQLRLTRIPRELKLVALVC